MNLSLKKMTMIMTTNQDDDLRKELSVVVVVIRVDIILSIFRKLIQCSVRIRFVNVDHITSRPHFNADQHEVDALLMIQLQ